MNKILVVEDDERITKSLTIRLQNEGYETMCAEDSTNGMRMVANEKPDLLILDVMMPAGGGIWMAENLRSSDETDQIPIIFITASRKEGVKEKALAMDNVAFIEKPYDATNLLRQVSTMLHAQPGRST